MRLFVKPGLALASLYAISTAALACPLCHTETGQQVRAGILGPGFATNLLAILIPFAICLAVTALIYFGGGKTS